LLCVFIPALVMQVAEDASVVDIVVQGPCDG